MANKRISCGYVQVKGKLLEDVVGVLYCEHGLTQEQIASQLNCSTRTVRRIIGNLKIDCNASNLAQLSFMYSNMSQQTSSTRSYCGGGYV